MLKISHLSFRSKKLIGPAELELLSPPRSFLFLFPTTGGLQRALLATFFFSFHFFFKDKCVIFDQNRDICYDTLAGIYRADSPYYNAREFYVSKFYIISEEHLRYWRYASYMMCPTTDFAFSKVHVIIIPITKKEKSQEDLWRRLNKKIAFFSHTISEFIHRGKMAVGHQAAWQTWMHPLDNCLEVCPPGLGSCTMSCLWHTACSAFVFPASSCRESSS